MSQYPSWYVSDYKDKKEAFRYDTEMSRDQTGQNICAQLLKRQ